MSPESPPLGRSTLPPKFLIGLGQLVWSGLWHLMMSKLAPRSTSGGYVRPTSQFHHRIGTREYPSAKGRYQLLVGMGCPWAHRTLLIRVLKGLEAAVPIVIVQPSPTEGGWVFDQPKEGCHALSQLYALAQPGYGGRATVPVLWDSETKSIVNNESAEIIVLLNDQFNELAKYPERDYYPISLRPEIDCWNEKIYHTVNNGVYRCGFAQTQSAYDVAVTELFSTLDELDGVLATNRYLCGNWVTLADIRLFTTLFRFDVVYHGLFKCNLRRIRDYLHLGAYLRDLYQLPGVASTCDLTQIKRDYYGNLFPLNPGGIIPSGPDLAELLEPHGREKLS
ncbi:glutathione S-transferase family protein [Candidatus Cyanaurora vandensis]|uniref:glutathione S-transferase family protein n=1 Tax=Candidatus Cyanaurora vandensis TaxID=2714958 RepID=UPI00257F581D|nr:glutathione S-transferase family protein [Candidatus Cyanaurora vandensis]